MFNIIYIVLSIVNVNIIPKSEKQASAFGGVKYRNCEFPARHGGFAT